MKKYGRYFLLDLLNKGGMAEIFRARSIGDHSSKIIAVKKIISDYGLNPEFQKMFFSEIKLLLNLAHPNIIQVFDFGEEDKQPFLAMEYVEGPSLRNLYHRIVRDHGKFPVDLAVYICEQAAFGLSYAHSFRDPLSGEELKIVHRDISPQNILCSFEGQIKIIDFGISKAKNSLDLTRTGTLKGKPCYMAPEYVLTGKIDHRYDIFGLGIVLWELLTGRRLFTGENELAILRQVENCEKLIIPPSEINPEVPIDLDQVVLKALEKKPERRYRLTGDFQRELRSFLVKRNPFIGAQDLSQSIRALFGKEIYKDRKRLKTLYLQSEEMIRNLIPSEELEPSPPPSQAAPGIPKVRPLPIHLQTGGSFREDSQSETIDPFMEQRRALSGAKPSPRQKPREKSSSVWKWLFAASVALWMLTQWKPAILRWLSPQDLREETPMTQTQESEPEREPSPNVSKKADPPRKAQKKEPVLRKPASRPRTHSAPKTSREKRVPEPAPQTQEPAPKQSPKKRRQPAEIVPPSFFD